ncbi:MAG: hypothetical protein AAFX65_10530 [Cyanobacteria bacterium J06638_7]
MTPPCNEIGPPSPLPLTPEQIAGMEGPDEETFNRLVSFFRAGYTVGLPQAEIIPILPPDLRRTWDRECSQEDQTDVWDEAIHGFEDFQ